MDEFIPVVIVKVKGSAEPLAFPRTLFEQHDGYCQIFFDNRSQYVPGLELPPPKTIVALFATDSIEYIYSRDGMMEECLRYLEAGRQHNRCPND